MESQKNPSGAVQNIPSANLQSVGILLLSVALGAVGQLTLKQAVNGGKLTLSLDSFVKMATNPLLIIAIGIYGVSAVFWLLALMRADLSFAYPFLSLTYIAVLVGGAILFHEEVTFLRVTGFLVIIAGLLVIAYGERSAAGNAVGK